MHNETVKALYDYFSLEDKNDFYAAFLYLKHIDVFLHKVLQSLGMPTRELPHELPADVDAMMDMYIQQISDAAPSADTSIYHAKVVKFVDALKLVSQKKDVNVLVPEQVVPFKIARDIVLHNPESIAVGRCPCRAAAQSPCLPEPMEVCLFIGDPVASFLHTNNQAFRPCTPEEAVGILEYSRERGLVHTAWFKKELGNTFHMICNCCSCCCMGVKMWNLLGGTIPILAPSGYVAEVNDDCTDCTLCVDHHTCHFDAISMSEETHRAVIDLNKCMGCGVCETACPDGAITLRLDPSKGAPLDLDALVAQQQA